MLTRRQRRLGTRASVSVEMALTTIFVLLPLVAGGADFLQLVVAKAEMYLTLRSFDAYGWNNPADATDVNQLSSILAAVNRHSLTLITFPDGKTDSTTSYEPALSYECGAPPFSVQTLQSTPCARGDMQQILLTYQIIARVALAVPMPLGLTSPFLLVTSGQVQIE